MLATRHTRRQFVEFRGSGTGLLHLPGLDGLRGLAVAGVVLFHTDLGIMPGGFLGVSTFFTLSGFLITSLLINESAEHSGVDLRRFWSRRFRRLLPASLVVLFAVTTLFAWLVAVPAQRDALRVEVWAALAQVANWQLILSGSSYGDLFVAPSPVLHFWSLAIEEQFYLILPLLVIGLWRVTGGRKVVLGAALGALALVSAVEPLVFEMSRDRVYFGTDTRAAELLLGGVLAVVLSHRGVRSRLAAPGPVRTSAIALGVAIGLAQLVMWATVPQSAGFLYQGGFAAYAVMTTVVVVAASLPWGPTRALLGVGVLQWLGRRSYGIYLIHWPIFLVYRQTVGSWSPWLLAVVGIATSLILAEVSYRVIEQPIRLRQNMVSRHFTRAAIAGIVLVALCAAFLPTDSADPEGRLDFDQAVVDQQAAFEAAERARDALRSTSLPSGAPVPSISSFGDSTAIVMSLGLLEYANRKSTMIPEFGEGALGCGVVRFEERRVDDVIDVDEECPRWPEKWQASIDTHDPDIAQIFTGAWEVTDARIPGGADVSAIGDPEVDEFITSELLEAVDILGSKGAMVLLVLWPQVSDFVNDGASPGVRAKSDPERMLRLHEIMRDVAAQRPDSARILDLQSMLADRLDDPELRPDGIHIPEETATELYEAELGDAVLDIWSEFWHQQQATATSTTTTPVAGAPG